MKCPEAKAALDAYVDAELPLADRQRVPDHLQSCVGCQGELRELQQLTGILHEEHVSYVAPPHLKARVSDELKRVDDVRGSWFGSRSAFAYSLPALVVGLVMGWAMSWQIDTRTGESEFLSLLASAHVRSLMADHLTDVASSDSHTVKPWFHGRVDFSPPVHDLTLQGYPLLGGRLAYVSGKATAALIYKHRQHIINVFIQSASNSPGAASDGGVNGYHVLHWRDGGLAYWAVSDLNVADLDRFRDLLRDAASSDLGNL